MAEQRKPGFGPPNRGPNRFGPVEKPKNTGKTLLRLLSYLGKNKVFLILLIVAVVAMAGSSLLSPIAQKGIVETITLDQNHPAIDWDGFKSNLLFLAIVSLLSIALNLTQGLLGAELSNRTVKLMRNDLFNKFTTLPVRYFDTHTHGELMSRLTNDIDNVSSTLSQSLATLIQSAITVIGALSIMLYYSWLMTLITLLAIPIGLVVTKMFAKKTREYFKKQQATLGQLNGHIEEMVTGQKTVQAFTHEESAKEKFGEINENLRSYSIKAQIFSGCVGPLMNVVGNLTFALVAVSGGLLAIYQPEYISIAVIVAFINLSKQFSRPVNEIANQYNQIQSAVAGAERVFDVLDQIPEVDEGTTELDLAAVQGQVDIEDVNFSYKEGTPVLRDFTLHVPAGHKIALVGPTGAGKTTVVNLLTRFYDVNEGSIKLDGLDLREITKRSLRSGIGIVLQDTVLFTGTIRDNIRFGRLDATDEEVEVAAKASYAHEFISRLPEGYDTPLSESGSNISQGQRQLLSIARAFLANPKILILDEATSSIDTRTEMHVQRAMIRLMEGRTSFIIAHRLSTIRDADRIVVIEAGRIAEQGNHQELLAKKGSYYTLYQTQFANEA